MQRNLSAEKDARQNEKRRTRNRVVRSHSRTLVKDFVDRGRGEEEARGREAVRRALVVPRQRRHQGRLHRNTAARKKSRMNLLLNKMGS